MKNIQRWLLIGMGVVVLGAAVFLYIRYIQLRAFTTAKLKTSLESAGLQVSDHENSAQEDKYLTSFAQTIKAIDSSALSGPKGYRKDDSAYWDISDIAEVEVDSFDTPTDAHLYYDQLVQDQDLQKQNAAGEKLPYWETDYYLSGNLVMGIPRFSATVTAAGTLAPPQPVVLDQVTLNKILAVFNRTAP